jgi:hypothetical protein
VSQTEQQAKPARAARAEGRGARAGGKRRSEEEEGWMGRKGASEKRRIAQEDAGRPDPSNDTWLS